MTRDFLMAALDGFQLQKQRIDSQIAEVQAMLDGSPAPASPALSVSAEGPDKRRHKRSAAVRKRMAEAQRARWAKIKGESASVSPEPPKAKRQISEEGRKNIIAASKKRWRLQKAKAAAKSAPAKKSAAPNRSAVKKAAPAKAARKVARTKRAKAAAPTLAQSAGQAT